MGKIENDELRKIKNAHFIRAFEYVAQRKEMNQTQLASAIGSKTAYISVYRNGTRPVPEETIDALIRISATIDKGDGQIYRPYLHGLSDYMLLRNVPESEFVDAESRKNNPDYDLIQSRRNNSKYNDNQRQLDLSTYINALLAKSDETIASLKRELASKDEVIQEKDAKYKAMEKEKDARIAELKQLAEERLHRIAELRRVIDSHNISMTDYPFPVGAAEKQNQKRV